MKHLLSGSVFCALLLTAGSILVADSPQLAGAKALYAQASYEDALAQLNSITDADSANEVDQYRALCLLALGRDAEAEQSLERLVTRAPLFIIKEDEASPKLVTLFQQVRQRTLPGAAKDLYGKARASYDEKHFAEASAQFEEVLAILKEAPGGPASPSADLKELAEGFLKLTNAALTPAVPPPAPQPPPRADAPSVQPVRPPTPTIYTSEDRDVVPPVDIFRQLPPWQPPPAFAGGTLRGALQIDIDERGQVERAALVEPITPLYDSKLIAAAKQWRFQPARKNGVPVKFRKSIAILLSPPTR